MVVPNNRRLVIIVTNVPRHVCEIAPGQQHCHRIPSLRVVDRGRFQIDVDLGSQTVTLEDNVTDIFEIWRRFVWVKPLAI